MSVMQPSRTQHSPTVTVLLISSQHLGCIGVQAALQTQPDTRVIGDAQCAAEALTIAARERPTVILVATDVRSIALIPLLRDLHECSPDSHIIVLGDVLAAHEHPALGQEGIEGYLDWSMLPPSLLSPLIDIIAHGKGQWLVANRPTVQRLLTTVSPVPQDSMLRDPSLFTPSESDLTVREREVLALVATGSSYKQVAQRLCIAIGTVKSTMADIRTRWHLETSDQAIAAYHHLHSRGTRA